MGGRGIRYLSVADVIALYDVAMEESRQVPAALVREDALHAAVHHPRNLGYYAGAGLATQAVEMMLHVAAAHAWVDGNKRISALCLYAFLTMNGVKQPDEPSFRAAGDMLVAWLAASDHRRDGIRKDLVALVEGWAE